MRQNIGASPTEETAAGATRRLCTRQVLRSSSRGFPPPAASVRDARLVQGESPTGCMCLLPSLEPPHSASPRASGGNHSREIPNLLHKRQTALPLQFCKVFSTGCPNTLLQLLTTWLVQPGEKLTVGIWLHSSCICQASTGSTKNDLFGFLLPPSFIWCGPIPQWLLQAARRSLQLGHWTSSVFSQTRSPDLKFY